MGTSPTPRRIGIRLYRLSSSGRQRQRSYLQVGKALISLIREKVGGQAISHSRLLTASRMNARDFNSCMGSLVEKQAVVAMDVSIGYHNRNAKEYQLNPVLM